MLTSVANASATCQGAGNCFSSIQPWAEPRNQAARIAVGTEARSSPSRGERVLLPDDAAPVRAPAAPPEVAGTVPAPAATPEVDAGAAVRGVVVPVVTRRPTC
ncbi:hypothetical protein GCM10010488_30240 [Oerskovia jenensis]